MTRAREVPDLVMAGGRRLVVASALALVVAGLWPLAVRPGVLASLLAVFGGTLLAARWSSATVVPVVFALAYVSDGVVRWLAGPAVAAMPYWLAAFAGLAIGGAPWDRWQAAAPWRGPLAWWAVTVALLWPLSAWRANGDAFTWPLSPDTGSVVTAALLQLSLALWMDRLLAPAVEGLPDRDWWRGPLIASAVVTGGAAIYQGVVDPAWLSREPWITLQRSVGLMGDANPLGVATALWAPLALWAAITARGARLVLYLVAALVLACAAWLSGARTTIMLGAIGLAGLTWALAAGGTRSRTWPLAGIVGLTVLTGVGLTAVLDTGDSSPVARLFRTVPKSSPSRTAYELFWRRDGYGLAAVAAVREHPLVGVGIGRFIGLAPGYHEQVAGRIIPPDNAQNFWRHTLAEQGIVGLMPILWLTVLAGRALVTGRPRGEERLLRTMVAGLGVALLFGYPVQDASIAATLGTLVAVVARPRDPAS